jgi:hypothetical protein
LTVPATGGSTVKHVARDAGTSFPNGCRVSSAATLKDRRQPGKQYEQPVSETSSGAFTVCSK